MSDTVETIKREVTGWLGVEARPHRFNGVEFRVRRHEIGHLHGAVGGPSVPGSGPERAGSAG